MYQWSFRLFASASVCFISAEIAAQEAVGEEQELSEVIVTARLREEAAMDVPFALNTFDSTQLFERRIDDTHSLFRQVPGLSLTSFDDGRFAYFQLRGIGPLSQAISPDDGSVVTYVDGVPQPVYASEFAYVELERIEVLRGPQGTLFGRNSQGGAINITTQPPTKELQISTRIEAGESGYGLAQASISGPLVSNRLAADFTARVSNIDGFIENIAPSGGELGDRDSKAGRGSLVFTPQGDEGPRFTFTGQFDHQESEPFYYVRRQQSREAVELNPENNVDRTAWGLSFKAEASFDLFDLTVITALNGFENEQSTDDTDGLIYGPLFGGLPSSAFLPPLDFSDWNEEERRFYQEVRFSSLADNSLTWTAGAVYFHSDFDVELDNRSSFSPFLNGDRDAEQKIDSYAVFGEATLPLNMRGLSLTAGVRYTRDEKSLDAEFTGVGFPGTVDRLQETSTENFDLWTGRAALSWELNDSVNLYATAGRGAKSGGFPRLTLSAAIGAPSQAYAESTSWTYEAGLKADLFGRRGRIDLAAFYNDVTDEQLFVLDFVSFQFLPVNLDTRSYGFEAQGDFVLGAGWTLSGGVQWTEGEIREADAGTGARPGNDIPNVAPFSSTLTLGYEGESFSFASLEAVVSFTLTHQYVGERTADVANSFNMKDYQNIDSRLGLRFGSAEIYAFARNLTDERQEINAVLYGPGVEGSSLARPRVAGIGFTKRF
ncbi:MAG: TonB-dependent receptor [Congregibacter sp.]